MSFRTELFKQIPEKSTCRIFGTLLDENNDPVPLASLTALTVTLYDQSTKTVINGRSTQDIKGTNGGTVDANGLLTLVLSPLDTIVITSSVEKEKHVALIRWTYNAGTKEGKAEIIHTIANLYRDT